MKQFVVHFSDKQRELMDEDLLQAHVDYLRQLKEDDVLPFCGPCEDGTAIMILSCDSREKAQKLVAADLFAERNYYRERNIVEVEEATTENNSII